MIAAGRLKEVRRDGALTASYEYDENDNRLQLTTPNGVMSGVYDAQDRLTTYGSTTYSYGSSGELKTKTASEGTTNYTYDALGNLTAAGLPDGTQITYVIDGQNRRVGKRVNGVLVQGFLYQSQRAPIAELDGNQQVLSRFVYGTRSNVPDYMIKGGTTYRLIADHLGSVRLVVNTTDGSVVQRMDYDEFGRVTQNTAPGFQPFGFAGGLLDNHTGFVRFGARDYDAATGRWTAKDPASFSGGLNLYSYAEGNPISLVDPTGLCPCKDAAIRLAISALQDVPVGYGLRLAYKGFKYGGRITRYGLRLAERGAYWKGGKGAIQFGRGWTDGVKGAVVAALIPGEMTLLSTQIEGTTNALLDDEDSSVGSAIFEAVVPFWGTARAVGDTFDKCL